MARGRRNIAKELGGATTPSLPAIAHGKQDQLPCVLPTSIPRPVQRSNPELLATDQSLGDARDSFLQFVRALACAAAQADHLSSLDSPNKQ